jgi:YD repeat-containing protein
VKVNWGGRSDDTGQVLEEKLPPGLYRATFWADGYESAQAAFEVRSGEVTRLSKVELKKKAVWLIVEEDYQDIANDGLWSVHLYYSYDEKGRLTEIDGERAAQHYRHYAYDENGLVTEQIEGSTGGFWTGRKYSYDELGRVIRIDSYLLMNADDWRDASWQENGYQTKRYEGENLAETGYYSDKQTLYYSYTYENNEAGLLVKEVEWSDGKADRVVIYEYDEQGRLIKSTSSSGRIITVTYEYNEAGQLSKETNLYSEYVTLYFYDEHGNMIREERYSRLGKKLASRTTYTYKQFPFED